MKIPIEKHKRYLSVEIDPETELMKIFTWLDKRMTEKVNAWAENTNPNKMTEDFFIWQFLVTTFNQLPDGKKTKAFVLDEKEIHEYAWELINEILKEKQS